MASTIKETHEQGLERGSLDTLLGFQLRRAQLKLFQHFKSSMADLPITPGQAGVLILIESNPGISQAALARAMDIERATLGETINDLEAHLWVERRKSTNDGRSHALYLSAKGKNIMKKLHPAIDTHEKDISGNLSASECRELLRLLMKFNAS
ncbi:MAG: DNA-binding MarR family transcriptional regulator [Gammaproteobacteria bacterium]|jgi:DNA-binding MarR family transcriptional regulator